MEAAAGILSEGYKEEFLEYTIRDLELRFGKRFWEKSGHEKLVERIYAQLINFALNKDVVELIQSNFPLALMERASEFSCSLPRCGAEDEESVVKFGRCQQSNTKNEIRIFIIK